jgi:hypothetical protein
LPFRVDVDTALHSFVADNLDPRATAQYINEQAHYYFKKFDKDEIRAWFWQSIGYTPPPRVKVRCLVYNTAFLASNV